MSEMETTMPRNKKCRNVTAYPNHISFIPEDEKESILENTVLSIDEYETIRLIDALSLTQSQCAEKMGVARTTVTAIYESARKKIADAIINGKRLVIAGGSISVSACKTPLITAAEKGADIMRIAVTYDNGNVFQHFGRTPTFKVYDVNDGKIVSEEVIDTNGSGHGALAGFLKDAGADVLVCGGIGPGAQMALMQMGIELYAGVYGNADQVIKQFINGTLSYSEEATCDHHGHDHEHNHGCGSHGCGNHGCH